MMSDQWLYRIYGQEFGPVSLDLIRTLVASGTIAPDDEVRDVTRSNWILACAATELSDSIDSQKTAPETERRTVRDKWFCRGYAGDYGPLKLSDLIQLAANRELQPDEEVKSGTDDYWKQIGSIRRLVELLPFPDDPRRSRRIQHPSHSQDSSATDWADILLFPGVQSINRAEDVPAEEDDEDLKLESYQPVEKGDCPFGGYHDQLEKRIPGEGQSPFSTDSYLDEAEHLTELFRQPITSNEIDDSPLNRTTNALANFGMQALDGETELETALNQMESDPRDHSEKWTGWIAGEEFGPVDYTELLLWAVTGRLAPTDFVRRGDEGQYVPAVYIPCLFTVRAAASSLSRPAKPLSIKIADEPSEQPELTRPENETSSLTLTSLTPCLPEATSDRKILFEARLARAVTSLQNFAWQFAQRFVNHTRKG